MPTDALIQLQSSVTKTASFQGTGVALGGGTPRRGLKARFIYSAASNASGSNTATFTVDVSRDGGSTWNSEFYADPITLSTTAQSGEIFVPFEVGPSTVGGNVQVRASVAIAGGGSTPTITYQSDITLSRP